MIELKRDLIWLSVIAAIAFAILISLGFWQLQRLAWKQALIAQIEERVEAEPMSLSEAISRWNKNQDIEYLRVRAEGRFLHDNEQHLFSVIGGKSGWRIFTPFETTGGEIVMADRGFVPDARKNADKRAAGQIAGEVGVVGLVRKAETPGLFTPDNTPEKNVWYWRDLQGMVRAAVPSDRRGRVVPFFVELEARPGPDEGPRGGATRLKLSNNHLQYALTWFGLAGGLLIVTAVYVFGRLRRHRAT